MSTLEQAFYASIDVFNATFQTVHPPTNIFAPYYDPQVVLHTPHVGIQKSRNVVLSSLAASAPLYFDKNQITNLHVNENPGLVKGNTIYTDTDGGHTKTFPISFEIHYNQDAGAPGGWIVIEAFSKDESIKDGSIAERIAKLSKPEQAVLAQVAQQSHQTEVQVIERIPYFEYILRHLEEIQQWLNEIPESEREKLMSRAPNR
jgi:hypothetical protein